MVEVSGNYKYVSGVKRFEDTLLFDPIDLLADTNQATVSVINRLYAKKGDSVREVLTWEVAQQRFFNPTFGGAVLPGERNVVIEALDLTGFTFLDGPRTYSPIVSNLRISPRDGITISWLTDYDPARHAFVNNSFQGDVRVKRYFVSVGSDQIRPDPIIAGPQNQFRFTIGYGDPNRKGWNTAFQTVYDVRLAQLDFGIAQVTYNTDCCGLSLQVRRFDFRYAKREPIPYFVLDCEYRVSRQFEKTGTIVLSRSMRIAGLACVTVMLAFAAGEAQTAAQYKTPVRQADRRRASGRGLQRLEYLSAIGSGNRLSGSEALDRAIAWSAEQMKAAGLENVRTIPVKVPHWVRGAESAEMLEPLRKKIYMLGTGGGRFDPERRHRGRCGGRVGFRGAAETRALRSSGPHRPVRCALRVIRQDRGVPQRWSRTGAGARSGGCAGSLDHATQPARSAHRSYSVGRLRRQEFPAPRFQWKTRSGFTTSRLQASVFASAFAWKRTSNQTPIRRT